MDLCLNIFEYTDYRKFLKDFYNQSKKANNAFSYRVFARKAGFSSSNFLYLIIEGKRNLTKEYILKFSNAIGLNNKEQQFFDALVSFNHAKDAEARRYYLELLYNLRKSKTGTLLTDAQYEFISTWYYPVIRELLALPDFKEDRAWIKKKLCNRVKGRQIDEAISTLIRLGLIQRDENRKLIPTEAHIITEDEVENVAAYKFHQQMLTLSKECLQQTEQHEREISGLTMAISEKVFQEVKRKIHEFEDEIIRLVANNEDDPERVYQLNLQLFPLTNGKNGGKK